MTHPVKAEMAMRRVSVSAVAKELGMNHQYVSRLLNGRSPTTPEFRARVSELFGLREDQLFHPQEPRQARSRYPGDEAL